MAKEGFDRRSFIKAAASVSAGVGAAGALGAAGYGIVRPVSDVGVEVVPISYPGVKVIKGSPAPYGLPLIPLEIDDNGEFVGRPDAREKQLKWYKYCSHERAPGTFSDYDGDNLLRFHVSEEKLAKGLEAWYTDLVDQTITPEDFPESEPKEAFSKFPGVGAPFRWRSEGVESESLITGLIIQAPKDEMLSNGSLQGSARANDEILNWMPEHPNNPDKLFYACCSFCTHFCCVPGFHTAEISKRSGYGDTIFCTCHLSRYDPFTFDQYNRTIFEYPNAGPGGGDGGESGGGSGGGGH
jgi:Rieske Fe-S protein